MSTGYDANVAIFWDYENCPLPNVANSFDVTSDIQRIAHEYGAVNLFRAYFDMKDSTSEKPVAIRSALQSYGVSLIDCPHNGKKEVVDKIMLVDIFAYALDNPAPATIMIISGDRDFFHATSILRLRKYGVVVSTLDAARVSLKSKASAVYDWPPSRLYPLPSDISLDVTLSEGEAPVTSPVNSPNRRAGLSDSGHAALATSSSSRQVARNSRRPRANSAVTGSRPKFFQSPRTATRELVDLSHSSNSTPNISRDEDASQDRASTSALGVTLGPAVTNLNIGARHSLPVFNMLQLRAPPSEFEVLVTVLERERIQGNTRVRYHLLGPKLKTENPLAYSKLREYVERAEKTGIVIVDMSGEDHREWWTALHPAYHGQPQETEITNLPML